MKISRRTFLGSMLAAGVSVPGYTFFYEPGWLDLSEVDIPLTRRSARKPVRILHLSDLHLSSVVSLDFIKRAIELGIKSNPDIICLTGDFVTAGDAFDANAYSEALKALSNAAPTFASLGNHDGGKWSGGIGGLEDITEITNLVSRSGAQVLHNANFTVSLKERTLVLVGLGDVWADQVQPEKAFAGVKSDEESVKIVLSHNPDSKELLKDYPWDLLLCGHTHGGQVVLPFLGAPIVPIRDRTFTSGLHPWNERWVYTTRGVGNLYGIRFNCRPEITILNVG